MGRNSFLNSTTNSDSFSNSKWFCDLSLLCMKKFFQIKDLNFKQLRLYICNFLYGMDFFHHFKFGLWAETHFWIPLRTLIPFRILNGSVTSPFYAVSYTHLTLPTSD